MEDQHEIISQLNEALQISLPASLRAEELISRLAVVINDLIAHDFQRLVRILYRVDVHEGRLKQLLKENPEEDAARIIAALLVDRQIQKIKSRAEFRRDNETGETGEERW